MGGSCDLCSPVQPFDLPDCYLGKCGTSLETKKQQGERRNKNTRATIGSFKHQRAN